MTRIRLPGLRRIFLPFVRLKKKKR